MSLKGSNPFRCVTDPFRDHFEEYLKEKRLAKTTIKYKIKLVKHLNSRCNLWDSDSVRDYIKNCNSGARRKNNLGYAYRDWCRWKGFDYEFERYKEKDRSIPFIPLEKEIDQLIAGFTPKYSPFLQLLKETGFRSIEARRLTPDDFDLERKTITLNDPAKNSLPRQFKISDKLISMLMPLLHKTKKNEHIWDAKANTIRAIYSRKRKKLAKKLGNPRLIKITLHTFRHWKATTEYHRTKDLLHVKQLLGHKNIDNTLIYTHLVDFEEDDQYVVKVAKDLKQFTELLENGFEYVSDYL